MLSKVQITALLFLGVGLLVVPPVTSWLDAPFYVSLFARIMIFAIAVVSLDLILGYGGMVSFGHAAYLGIGAYAVAIPSYYGIDNGYLQLALALGGSALVAFARRWPEPIHRPHVSKRRDVRERGLGANHEPGGLLRRYQPSQRRTCI